MLSLVKLELLEYRRKNNSFPSKLDVLGQAFLDPFDKKPLRYEKAEAGFKIWSIDRDLRDDGGLVRTTAGGPLNSPGDLVVQFP